MSDILNLKIENDLMFNNIKARKEQFDKICLEFDENVENVEKYKYSNGKIYKLSVEGHDKFYIGSTINILNYRLSKHKSDYKRFKIGKEAFKSSFILCEYAEKNGFVVKIELFEDYPCKNKLELLQREGFYINKYKSQIVNRCKAGMDYRNNKNNLKDYNANYYKDNRTENILQATKNYHKHKAELNKKFNCECGGHYTKSHKSEHFKSIKHINYLESLKIN